MKRFCFTYELALNFSAPVSRHTFLFRFHPASDERQQLWGLETNSHPVSALPLNLDAFGNLCACGHLEAPHEALSLRVRGDVLIQNKPVRSPCPDIYALPSPMTASNAELWALSEGLSGDPAGMAMRIAERIRERVDYRKGVTDERTTALQAWSLGAGVCQDLAHLLLAALRAKHIPARYVAGLIPGEGETHAWVEVYDGGRFIGIDPTQLRMVDDEYLCVNRGRDSRDCAINRGVFAGAAMQTMSVYARMTEI